jgi:hypothetical protein
MAGLLAWGLLLALGAYQVTTIDAVEGWPGDAAVVVVGLGLVGVIFAADRRWSRHPRHTRRP